MHAFFQSLPAAAVGISPPVSITPLNGYRCFAAEGADAIAFLHGQLTNDIEGLTTSTARLAGYCTAKGRLLATTVVWRAAEPLDPQGPVLYGLLRHDLLDAVLKRLSMFVLRAKVKLQPSALNIAGVTVAESAFDAFAAAAGGLPAAVWDRSELASGTWITAPSANGQRRFWWLATDEQLQSAAQPLGALAQRGASSEWRSDDLAAGLPWIAASTQDLFLPQTVNLDLIQGVSFTKGCYPGQEVVARSHYRGTVKRRMAFGTLSGGVAPNVSALPGMDIYDATHADEPCGRVIDAAGARLLSVLFETTLASLPAGDLRLGKADGPRIDVADLPYSITA